MSKSSILACDASARAERARPSIPACAGCATWSERGSTCVPEVSRTRGSAVVASACADASATAASSADSALEPHELRRRAKIVNYALLYGKTAFTLSKDIGVPQQAAQQFIDAYFAGFPRVRTFIDDTLALARETGFVQTLFGRRRPVPELTSRNGMIRAASERVAVNMPIQGTAADILKRAMIDVDAVLGTSHPAARMILTVHDELLFEAPAAEADAVAALVKEKMEHAVPLRVPLDVDVGIGENWREAKT